MSNLNDLENKAVDKILSEKGEYAGNQHDLLFHDRFQPYQ